MESLESRPGVRQTEEQIRAAFSAQTPLKALNTTGGGTCTPVHHTGRKEWLLATVREVLKREDVDWQSSFEAIGGNSLLAAVILARIWEHWGIRLPLSALDQSTHLADLMGRLPCEIPRRAET